MDNSHHFVALKSSISSFQTKSWQTKTMSCSTILFLLLLGEILMLIIIPPISRSLLFIGAGDSSLGDVVKTIGTKTPDGVYYKQITGNKNNSIIVVNFHGNYECISSSSSFFARSRSNIHTIYEIEYRGYGNVPGSPDEESLSQDLQSFITWVKGVHPNKRVILGGYSVGASLVLMNLHRMGDVISGAIVFSPFSSLTDIVKSIWFTKIFIVRDCGWNVIEELKKGTNTPVLIFGGEDDNVVPIDLTHKISKELKGKNPLNTFKTFESGGHFLPFSQTHYNQISKQILSFLKMIH